MAEVELMTVAEKCALHRRKIRELRQYVGLNQPEFAATVGMTQAMISDIERGRKSLSVNRISLICDVWQIDVRWFFDQGIIDLQDADLKLRPYDLQMSPQEKNTELLSLIEQRMPMVDDAAMGDLMRLVKGFDTGTIEQLHAFAEGLVEKKRADRRAKRRKADAQTERTPMTPLVAATG